MTPDVTVCIDPEFRGLCPPLHEEEYRQLEANLLADGCRDPLVVWQETGLLLDGHNRYDLCQEHSLGFDVSLLALPSREEAITWIITNQLGRRNLTPEQKSHLRGQRYNREKNTEGRPEKLTDNRLVSGPTVERLAAEYHVAPSTIQADGAFAQALDTLDEQVRADIREAVLKRQDRGKQQATKKQVTHAGKLIEAKKVEPLSFMQRDGWKPHQVLQAIDLLGTVPHAEHAPLNGLLDQPFLPADQGLAILKNLAAHRPAQRQHIYTLAASTDPREQSLAMTLAAQKAPEPDPQVILAGNLIKAVEEIRERQRRNWRLPYATEPWMPALDEIDALLAAAQERWRSITREAKALHQERITSHAKSFDPSR